MTVNFEKVDSSSKDILVVKLAVRKLVVYVFLVYLDAKDRYRNKYIYENMDKGIAAIVGNACVIVMGDFHGYVGFLGEQEKNYGGKMLLEFAERCCLLILNYDSKCKGVYTKSVKNEKSVIDYIMVNECTYRYFKLIEIDGDKVLYDLSDHVYVFMELIVGEDMPRYGGAKLEEAT